MLNLSGRGSHVGGLVTLGSVERRWNVPMNVQSRTPPRRRSGYGIVLCRNQGRVAVLLFHPRDVRLWLQKLDRESNA